MSDAAMRRRYAIWRAFVDRSALWVRRWIVAAALVAGCGGSGAVPQSPAPAPVQPSPAEPAPAEPAPAEPAPVQPSPAEPAPAEPAPVEPAPAAATAPTHEALLALLRASTYDLSSKPDSECANLATKDSSVLGPAIEQMLPDADMQRSSCEPAEGRAYRCKTELGRQHASAQGDDEWWVELDYQVNGETIDWTTLRCRLAG